MREVRLLLGQMVADSRRTKRKRDQSMSQSPDELEPSLAKKNNSELTQAKSSKDDSDCQLVMRESDADDEEEDVPKSKSTPKGFTPPTSSSLQLVF